MARCGVWLIRTSQIAIADSRFEIAVWTSSGGRAAALPVVPGPNSDILAGSKAARRRPQALPTLTRAAPETTTRATPTP
jgi:hypothetical protein